MINEPRPWRPIGASAGIRLHTVADLRLEDGREVRATFRYGDFTDMQGTRRRVTAWWFNDDPTNFAGVYDPIAWRPVLPGLGRERLCLPYPV